jgi:hypothetical protein
MKYSSMPLRSSLINFQFETKYFLKKREKAPLGALD